MATNGKYRRACGSYGIERSHSLGAGLDPEDYTSASWVAVKNALASYYGAAMDSPSQTRVDGATSLLTTAVGLLEEAVSA